MNAITEIAPLSANTAEHVLGTGDLSKLTAPQRVEYYNMVCKSLDLNPFTRPFRFLAFNGQIQLYATKDCTDQLRAKRRINLNITDKREIGELYVVTVRAKAPDGREDEDLGAVTIGKTTAEARANQMMKCLTKAKRRVTLSICGLGLTDESELDTMPGAATFDIDQDPPPASKKEPPPVIENASDPTWLDTHTRRLDEPDTAKWLPLYEDACATATAEQDLVRLHNLPSIKRALDKAPQRIKDRMASASGAAFKRLQPKPASQPALELDTEVEWPTGEITPADRLASG